jgi:hypothetical protein
MRTWSRRVEYEDRNRAAGLCVRSKLHGRRDPRSKNLCAKCLAKATGQPPKKPTGGAAAPPHKKAA